MYCIQCGTELFNDARFCMRCGAPVKGAATSSTQPEPRWEYCEITWTKDGWLDGACFFWAK